MNEIFVIEEYVVALLLIATLVGIVARRSRVPYTVGLVLVGAGLTIFVRQAPVQVDPDIILGVFIPPLIFEAAFHLHFREFRRSLGAILRLAIVGVLLTTFLVGLIVHHGAGIPLSSAIIFGAIVAATDPVAVIALFRTLGVPNRLQVLVEGESLLNDGTAIVVVNIAVAAAVTGRFSVVDGIGTFVASAGVGLAIGAILGVLASFMITRIDDHLIETALTFVLAYSAFLIAESLHVSGVLAVVAAALVNRNVGPRGMSSSTRIAVFNFWEFLSFLANSFVFLLIGLVVDLPLLLENWQAIVWGIAAALLARLIVVFGLFPRSREISWAYKQILFWGGLRGAISLALVLGLSHELDAGVSEQLRAMVFGLVLFTLLIQGTTMSWLVRRTGIVQRRKERDEFDLRRARVSTTRAAHDHLRKIHRDGMISSHVWEIISRTLDPYTRELTDAMHAILAEHPEVETEELDAAWREMLQFQRLALADVLADRGITEDVYNELVGRIDRQLAAPAIAWTSADDMDAALWELRPPPPDGPPDPDAALPSEGA